MRGYNIAATTGGYLARAARGGQSRLRAGAASLLGDVLESLDPEQLGALVKRGLRSQLEKIDLAPLLGQLLTAAIADRRHLPVLEGLIHRAALTIEDNEVAGPRYHPPPGQHAAALDRARREAGQ